MGRGKVGVKRNSRRRVQPKEKGSDESDEEYKVGEDEEYDESDDYSSLDGDESEEILADFEEEEDEEEKKVKRVVRSKKGRKSFSGQKANRIKKPQKRSRVSYKQEDDDDDDDEDDEDDEEFMLDASDCVDDEDNILVMKKNKKVNRPPLRKKGFTKRSKKSRKPRVYKNPIRRKARKNRSLTRKTSSANDGDVTDKNLVEKEKSGKISRRRKRRLIADSDSDFVSSGSSDYEYTISEEEREQVREASKICTNLNTSLRSSLVQRLKEEEPVCQQRKRPGRKGKEKVEDMKNEVGKQVCGICLSEEGKNTVRGSLNCCSHYFCFACIMEWSKVESRCPLCKQRFMTISKPANLNTGFDLRTVVIQVPERDQVYQPSEEELRGYLDPYENVICTECQHGGDDALMLLCDICDSPAHTYCVGLGREVPEGNWYCECCRPTAFGSLNPHGLTPTPDRGTNSNMSGLSSPVVRGIDLNAMYVPETPLTQETGVFSSSRRPVGDFHASSPASGLGAFTVLERRRIHRQIHHLLNNRVIQSIARANGTSASSSGIRLFGSQLDQVRELIPQQTITPQRIAPPHTFSEGRLEDNTIPLMRNRDLSSARSGHVRGQGQTPTSTSVDGSLQAELGEFGMAFNSRLVHDQLHHCTSRSSFGSDASPSPYACREVSHFNVEKGQVQQMVRSHLKSLSRDIQLGYNTFRNIARRSTHTILAACGLEHKGSEVHPVQPSLICDHIGVQAGAEMSLMKGYCLSCFDLFVKDVARKIMNASVSEDRDYIS